MLTHLHIRDFAIIEELELELAPGMTALTGETGAGKSIVVDALGLVLGDRADSAAVRHGADKAEIMAEFNLANAPAAARWLNEQALDEDGACHLRRVVGADGRSRAFINGRSVPVQSLRELGERLVDIHGQHEHQSLARRDTQLRLLDNYGEHAGQVEAVARAHAAWREVHDHLERLRADAADRDNRLDLLRFQVRELEALALAEGEYAELEAEHHRLAHTDRLVEGTRTALDLAYENDEASAQRLLAQAVHSLESLLDTDPRLRPVFETLNSALIALQEGADDLRRYVGDLELDPERRDWVESRIATAQQLARKHRVEAAELPALQERLAAELAELENAGLSLERLEKETAAKAAAYRESAEVLHRLRADTAGKLAARVTQAMHELGMPGGRFEIEVEAQPESRFGPNGWDRVEFRVSANPGQPPQPLARVASGGELSRIALAIQVIAAHATEMPAMVFDEVDAGVGGGVAEIVGRRLRALGESRQVLCVTHLPQVASQAHQQLKVEKLTGGNVTRTTITPLDMEARVEELARMLGGMKITETTRRHAREMIEQVDRADSRRA